MRLSGVRVGFIVLSTGAVSTVVQAAEFLSARHVYVRGEKVTLDLALDAGTDAVEMSVSGRFAQSLKPKADTKTVYNFDTALLRSGNYEVLAQPMRDGQKLGEPLSFSLSIAPAPNPERFPVWSWSTPSIENLEWWKARGFNGFRLGGVTDPGISAGRVTETTRFLEEGARYGFQVGLTLNPLQSKELAKTAASDGRNPKLYPRNPVVEEHARRTVDAWMKRFGDYPALGYSMLSTEYQVPPLSSKIWASLAEKELGLKPEQLPKQAWFPDLKNVYLDAEKLPAELQPKNGIIEDDNAIYRYLQWWWQRGHGTSLLNADMAKIIKGRRPDMITWHDPYRLAPVRNSHMGLDMVSTWTYGHPDIKRLGYTSVLQAAARPEKQKVMQTITLYMYDRYVRPLTNSTADLANDQAGQDEAYNQGPDYIREATWLVMSQRPDVLGYFQTGALSPDKTNLDPYVTSPESFDAIGEVCRTLVEPYGPAILKSQREKPKVAVLMSASALWFNGSRGWVNEAILPFTTLLMMNHVPFDVVLDEDITEGRLNQYDALVIPNGEVLLRGVHERIAAYAKGGKKVIADRSLAADIPGAHKTNFDFSFHRAVDGTYAANGKGVTAEEFRTRMETYAEALKPQLAGLEGVASTTGQRVLVNTLQSGDVQYIFAINDDKTYGPRFGGWKLHQELGVRQEATIHIANAGGKTLYDALGRREIKGKIQRPNVAVNTVLPASRGKLIAVLPEKISKIEITLPEQGQRGQVVTLGAKVLGVSGKSIAGSLPLHIQIWDALGNTSEYTRYAATLPDGSGYSMPLTLALNDEAGTWRVRITDCLGNIQAERQIAVK